MISLTYRMQNDRARALCAISFDLLVGELKVLKFFFLWNAQEFLMGHITGSELFVSCLYVVVFAIS